MGVSYNHFVFFNKQKEMSSKQIAIFLKNLQNFGLLIDEEIEVTDNRQFSTSRTWKTTVEQFVSTDYQKILNCDFLLKINLMNSKGNPERYAKVFRQETFEIDRVEELYASDLYIISSTSIILPFSEQMLDVLYRGRSIFHEFQCESEFPEKNKHVLGFFLRNKREKRVTTFPFLHHPFKREIDGDILVHYQNGSTGENIEYTCEQFHVGICFDMNKCTPEVDLNCLEMTDAFLHLLKKEGFDSLKEFAAFD